MLQLLTSLDQTLFISFAESCRHLHSVEQVKQLSLTSSQANQIEQATHGQSANDLWFQMREGRISASNVHEVYTRTKSLLQQTLCPGVNVDCSALISLCVNARSCKSHLPALLYGKETESEAVGIYSAIQSTTHTHCHVGKCGLFVDETRPYLCASPDAVVSCDCCGQGLLEVKCPLSSAGIHPSDANLPYLQHSDGKLVLKHSHKYYAQIQCQMAVRKRPWCDFFVYSRHGYHLERIFFDASYWEERFNTIEAGFFDYVVPSLIVNTQ